MSYRLFAMITCNNSKARSGLMSPKKPVQRAVLRRWTRKTWRECHEQKQIFGQRLHRPGLRQPSPWPWLVQNPARDGR